MTAREMKSLSVRTSAAELETYRKQAKKEKKTFSREAGKKFTFSNWVRWKLNRPVDAG